MAPHDEDENSESEEDAEPMADPADVVNAINQGITALSNTTMNATAAASPPVVPAAPLAGQFLRIKLQAGVANVLDLNQKDRCKYYELTIRSLFLYKELYDIDPK